jgi:predicted nucleotidyltransferase component of viral defense system
MRGLGLRFKGGTCLKKAHFPDYRFSEDLDLTLEDGSDADIAVDALNAVAATLSEHDLPMWLGEPDHGENGVTYLATATGPLGSADKLKIDLTTREALVFPAIGLDLVDEYTDRAGSVTLHCYSKEEIALEKIICLLDPARIQPRDLYDLDQLMGPGRLDVDAVAWAFPDKARFKGLDPSRLREALERKSPQLRRRWNEQLSQQVPSGTLPGFDDVERRFMRAMRERGLT